METLSPATASEAAAAVRSCNLLLCMRLHASILAGARIPRIGISRGVKTAQHFTEMEIPFVDFRASSQTLDDALRLLLDGKARPPNPSAWQSAESSAHAGFVVLNQRIREYVA